MGNGTWLKCVINSIKLYRKLDPLTKFNQKLNYAKMKITPIDLFTVD